MLCVQISLLQTARILVAVFDAIVAAINGDTSNSATGVTWAVLTESSVPTVYSYIWCSMLSVCGLSLQWANCWKVTSLLEMYSTCTIYMYSIHVQYTCTVYMYSIHVRYTCTVYMYSIHVQYTCTVYMYITCTVYMYSIHVQHTWGKVAGNICNLSQSICLTTLNSLWKQLLSNWCYIYIYMFRYFKESICLNMHTLEACN